jgi:hypothetical protein
VIGLLRCLHDQAKAAERHRVRLGRLYYACCRETTGAAVSPGGPASLRELTHADSENGRHEGAARWPARAKTILRDDGTLLVVAPGREPFVLKPHLASLFLALARDTGVSDDDLVAFKSLDDLSRELAKHPGRTCLSKATVNKYVARLREVFVRHGIDGSVIEISRTRGRRIALERQVRQGRHPRSPTVEATATPADGGAFVGDLRWCLRTQVKAAERLEEQTSAVLYSSCRVFGIAPSLIVHPPTSSVAPQSAPRVSEPFGTGAWLALTATVPKGDGTIEVSVRGHRPFLLQPHLAALFVALAEDTGVSDDDGIAFKSLDELSRRMAKRTRQPCLPQATVNKYVARLRGIFRAHGVDGRVIDVSRRLGRRLAITRSRTPGNAA